MVIRIFRHYWQLHFALLALADLTMGLVAYLLVHHYGLAGAPALSYPMLAGPALVFAACICVSMAAMGLYSARQRSDLGGIALRMLLAVIAGALADAFLALILFVPHELQLTSLVAAACLVFIAGAGVRMAMERVIDENLLKRKVLLYGAGRRASSIAKLRRRSDRRGFVIVGFVPAEGDEPTQELADHVVPNLLSLRDYCRQHQVDEIVVAMDDRRRSFPMDQLLDCRLDGVEVTELVSFLERETGKLRLDVLNPSWMIFSDGFRRGRIHSVLERALDLFASLALTLAAAPLMLLTALAIKLEDGLRASILYRQERVGQYGQPFFVLKFRSMREDAERDGKPQWATKNDSRVTRVGSFIRKTRVDELPQILNVLRGEMSFVGPRPERPEFVMQLSEAIPYYRERHTVKPGVTGWAQLCYPYGSSEQDALEKLQYDLYYVKNHSLLFYLAVLIQTVEVIVLRKGSR